MKSSQARPKYHVSVLLWEIAKLIYWTGFLFFRPHAASINGFVRYVTYDLFVQQNFRLLLSKVGD